MLLVVCVTVDASEHGIKRRICYTDIIVCRLCVVRRCVEFAIIRQLLIVKQLRYHQVY